MKIPMKNWNNYVTRLSAINKTAGRKMQAWIDTHGTDDVEALVDVAYALATRYGEAASATACQMYDETAQIQKAHVTPAEPKPTQNIRYVDAAVRGALSRAPSTVPKTVSELVKRTGAETTLKNAVRDGAYFAWVPRGDTCPFCITLASNGWRKASKKTVNGDHAEHIHHNCNCEFAISFNGPGHVEGYDPDKYREMYDNAEGGNWKDKMNSMRRAHYAANKDMINAQKRAAYVAREEQKVIEKLRKSGLKLSSNTSENGIINIEIDELVPCLRNLKTGKLVDTTVGVVTDRSILKGFNKQTGWYINWRQVPKDCTIMALRVKGNDEIQGLVAFKGVPEHLAVRGHWAVANPKSNKQLTDSPEYSGIGGHLFAIMAQSSKEMGYDGFIEGQAANGKLLEYYMRELGAKPLGNLDFYIDEVAAEEIIKKYNWEKE